MADSKANLEGILSLPEYQEVDSQLDSIMEKIPYSENAVSILDFFEKQYLASDEETRILLYVKAKEIVTTGASTEASINAMMGFIAKVNAGELPLPQAVVTEKLLPEIDENSQGAPYQENPELN